MNESRALLRHFLAALAYRTQKALRDAPPEYAEFRAAPNVRTPHELLQHMTSVMGYARTLFLGGEWRPERVDSFAAEIQRFHEVLEDLGRCVDTMPLRDGLVDAQLLQGPFADAMTHAGQLAMLRRLCGSPVPSENFVFAKVNGDNLSADQPDPAAPDKWWKPDWCGSGPQQD